MGNSKSTSSTVSDSVTSQQQASLTTASAQAGSSSGVFLTNDLQEQVMADFRSQVIKQQWEHHQTQLLEKVSHRQQQAKERNEKLVQDMHQWSIQNEKLQFDLNSKIDERMSKLADMCHAANYDLQRIEMKFIPSNSDNQATLGNNTKNPCLLQQVNLASCYKSNPKEKSAVCDIYVTALDSCIKEVFLKKQ